MSFENKPGVFGQVILGGEGSDSLSIDLDETKMDEVFVVFPESVRGKIKESVKKILGNLVTNGVETSKKDYFQIRRLLSVEFFALNKAILADACRQRGISQIEVTYEGSGDSGGLETMTAYLRGASSNPASQEEIQTKNLQALDLMNASDQAALRGDIGFLFVDRYSFTGEKVFPLGVRKISLSSFVEEFSYDAIYVAGFEGYENNEGGSGKITFTVDAPDEGPDGCVQIEHDDYYTTSTRSEATL